MDKKMAELDRKIRLGWYLLAAGGLLILFVILGATLNAFRFQYVVNPKLLAALGLLVIGGSIGVLAKYLTLKRNPEVAKRVLVEEIDERNQAIRYRSGNKAFEISLFISILALIIYSAPLTALPHQEPDLLWYFLAFLVVVPLVVYVISLLRYQDRY